MNVFLILLNDFLWFFKIHVMFMPVHRKNCMWISCKTRFTWNSREIFMWISHTGILLPVCTCYWYVYYFVVRCLIQIGAAKGRLKNFVIEPFIKHEQVCRRYFMKTWYTNKWYTNKAEFIICIYFETSSRR